MVNFFESISNNVLTYDSFREMSYEISIFYPHMQYNQIIETPKTSPIDLFSQIGGSLGMFFGLSLFHVMELFEIAILIVHVIAKK